MNTHPTLYKRKKTGAIQYWKICTVSSVAETIIRKESGQLGTVSPIIHDDTLTEGKNYGRANATNHEQQAVLQAASDWKKKKDEGYKSVEDLIDDKGFDAENLGEWLEARLPKFNTDASGNAKPMLAKTVNWAKVEYPCYAQPKLDGVRSLMIVNPEEGPIVRFITRKGKEITTLGHIAADIEDYLGDVSAQLKALNDEGVPSFVLDGEIFSYELTFQEIVSAVKAQKPNSLKLKFRAYDIVNDEPQSVRWPLTKLQVGRINSDHVTLVDTHIARSKDEVQALYADFMSKGYEGAMIRHLSGTYGQGQRSSDLLKVKEFIDGEFAFIRFEHGQRGVEDLIAVCINESGDEFRAKMRGNLAEKVAMYDKMDELEGTSITIKYFELTDAGLPRFPVGVGFRDYE